MPIIQPKTDLNSNVNTHQPIGVFDSGVGGISVLKHLKALLPNESFIYVADSYYAPYGSKSVDDIQARCIAMTDFLIAKHVKAIVVACNTATAAAATLLRTTYPLPIIGMEPAVKPAATATKTGVIGVLATVGTLQSAQFAALLASYGQEVNIVTQGCEGLVERIERGALNDDATLALVNTYCQPLLAAGADTIVLGCTHYPFVQHLIRQVVGDDIALIETGPAVAKQLQHRLVVENLLRNSATITSKTVQLAPSGHSQAILQFYTNSLNPNAQAVISQLWHANTEHKNALDIQAF